MTSLRRRIKQTGVTLIELLVAMTLGALVIGTVVALYTNTSSARAQSQALAEMNEDGLYALRILGQQLRLAGFNPVQPGRLTASPSNEPLRNPAPWGTSTLPIFACSSGFANAENTATFTGISISALTCSTTNTTSHAIAVTYEADIYNTEPTAAPALPTDCTGSSLPMQTTMTVPGRPHNYYYVENRFYVKNNSLFCTGNGGGTVYAPPTQPLIANIEQLNFQFGVMMPTTTNIITIPVGYLDAAQIGSSSGVDATANVNLQTYDATNRWDKISTVVICVLMRSNREILADPAPYYGCDATAGVIVPTDRFARRAFISTVNLRNSR